MHAWCSLTTCTQGFIQNHRWMCALWQLRVRAWLTVGNELWLLLRWTFLWCTNPSHLACGIPASECLGPLDYIRDFQNQTFRRCYGNTEPESYVLLKYIKVWEPQMLCAYIDRHMSILDTYSGLQSTLEQMVVHLTLISPQLAEIMNFSEWLWKKNVHTVILAVIFSGGGYSMGFFCKWHFLVFS